METRVSIISGVSLGALSLGPGTRRVPSALPSTVLAELLGTEQKETHSRGRGRGEATCLQADAHCVGDLDVPHEHL